MDETRRFFAGIDWGSKAHQVYLSDAQGRQLGERAFEHSGAGLSEMAAWLIATSNASPGEIHVAIETPHGPVVEFLLEHGFVLHALNPKQLDRFRDRYSPAGAKDDQRDAKVLSQSLRTDPDAFQAVAIADPVRIELREFSRLSSELVTERTALSNRLREQLWRYYPQFLDLTDDLASDWALALWMLAPTPAKARSLRETILARFIKQHRIRRFDAPRALACLRAPAITLAPGAVEAASAHVRTLVARLELLNKQIKAVHARLDTLTNALQDQETEPGQSGGQRDVTILRSLPGLGRIVLATLQAEAWQALQRRDYHALRCWSGVAPVTKRSGKSRLVFRRYACHRRLREAIYHWARRAVQLDAVSRAKYAALRARGHTHARALRQVADRLLAMACAMLANQTIFDPDRAKAAQYG